MTTDLSEAQAKAIRVVEAQIEAVGFDIDANSRQTQISLERHMELVARRKDLTRLLRMLGGILGGGAPPQIVEGDE